MNSGGLPLLSEWSSRGWPPLMRSEGFLPCTHMSKLIGGEMFVSIIELVHEKKFSTISIMFFLKKASLRRCCASAG